MFYLTTHSTHFIYGYMASDIWLRTIQIARDETRCRHMGYSFRLTARVLLYALSQRQDKIYNGLRYTSRGALAGTRNRLITAAAIMTNTNCKKEGKKERRKEGRNFYLTTRSTHFIYGYMTSDI